MQKRGVPLSIVEIEFSLLRRRTEALVAECLKLNITVLAWAPRDHLQHAGDGARTKAQAVENCGAAGWRLRPEDVQALDAVAVLDGGTTTTPRRS